MGGVYDAAKDALALARRLDDAELVQKILDLQSEALEMQDKHRELREQIGELEERLSLRRMEFRDDGMYWDGEDGPFCPACVDGDRVRARVSKNPANGFWVCNVCKNTPPGTNPPGSGGIRTVPIRRG